MRSVSVPWSPSGEWTKTQQAFDQALRMDVPIVHHFRGLAVTPTTGMTPGFTVTHVATGCAVPPLTGLPFDAAMGIAAALDVAFPWHLARDVFFFRDLHPSHQQALKDCILALREMFGVE